MPESLDYEGSLRICLCGIYFQTNILGVEAHVVFFFNLKQYCKLVASIYIKQAFRFGSKNCVRAP